jgi:hypothetical protein
VTGEGRCHINPVTPFTFGELRSRLLFLVRILLGDFPGIIAWRIEKMYHEKMY